MPRRAAMSAAKKVHPGPHSAPKQITPSCMNSVSLLVGFLGSAGWGILALALCGDDHNAENEKMPS